MTAVLGTAVRGRVPEYRKAEDDAAKAFSGPSPTADGPRSRIVSQTSLRGVRTNTTKYVGKSPKTV